jgi:uncharacterized protein YjiS (DUF1127 family)
MTYTQEIEMLQRIINHLHARQMYKKTINELNALSDKELQDIGISRGMIGGIARDTYDEYLREFDSSTNPNLRGWV